MDDRRRVDPILEEARRLLPPEVDVVAVPAGVGGRGGVEPGAAAAAETGVLEAVRRAWAVLFADQPEPPATEIRWVRSTDGRRVWTEASAVRSGRVEPDEFDRAVRALRDMGWTAERRDRGHVWRVLAQTALAALEIQIRHDDAVVAVRARSAALPVIPPASRP